MGWWEFQAEHVYRARNIFHPTTTNDIIARLSAPQESNWKARNSNDRRHAAWPLHGRNEAGKKSYHVGDLPVVDPNIMQIIRSKLIWSNDLQRTDWLAIRIGKTSPTIFYRFGECGRIGRSERRCRQRGTESGVSLDQTCQHQQHCDIV